MIRECGWCREIFIGSPESACDACGCPASAELTDLDGAIEPVYACNRCGTHVTFENVTDGYFAACPTHDEDLFKFECELVNLPHGKQAP